MIARMQIRETAWSQLLSDSPPEARAILQNDQWEEIKDAQSPAGFILIDTIGTETDIDALYNYFQAGDRQSIWKWEFDGKVDFATEYTGQHNDILATQPVGSSFQDPIWSHSWMGQDQNRYAREFSREFSEEFG